MNILFTSQGIEFSGMFSLYQEFRRKTSVNSVGFYVSESRHYDSCVRDKDSFEEKFSVVKEWEVMEDALKKQLDYKKIKILNQTYGDSNFWDAVVCDRRLYLGKNCKWKQDYKPQYTHEQLMLIIQTAINKLEKLLEDVKPDIVLSCDLADFGKYLLWLICKKKNIPMLVFRTTKIQSYIEAMDVTFGASSFMKQYFAEYNQQIVKDEFIEQAKSYLKEFEQHSIAYEGQIMLPINKGTTNSKTIIFRLKEFFTILFSEIKYRRFFKSDHQVIPPLKFYIYNEYFSKWKYNYYSYRLKSIYQDLNMLTKCEYVFFPMHSEPELATLVWGKGAMNQIEVIRNIARSLPIHYKLAVKEHPRSLGYRKLSYYKKLLNIPNVVLVNPLEEVRDIILNSKMVISISTFVAFEAVLLKKPSMMLGEKRPFSLLDTNMLRYVSDFNNLFKEIDLFLKEYQFNYTNLISYIAATIKSSIPINYFTDFLKKQQRFKKENINSEESMKKFANYLLKKISSVTINKI